MWRETKRCRSPLDCTLRRAGCAAEFNIQGRLHTSKLTVHLPSAGRSKFATEQACRQSSRTIQRLIQPNAPAIGSNTSSSEMDIARRAVDGYLCRSA